MKFETGVDTMLNVIVFECIYINGYPSPYISKKVLGSFIQDNLQSLVI